MLSGGAAAKPAQPAFCAACFRACPGFVVAFAAGLAHLLLVPVSCGFLLRCTVLGFPGLSGGFTSASFVNALQTHAECGTRKLYCPCPVDTYSDFVSDQPVDPNSAAVHREGVRSWHTPTKPDGPRMDRAWVEDLATLVVMAAFIVQSHPAPLAFASLWKCVTRVSPPLPAAVRLFVQCWRKPSFLILFEF